jgi:LysM repeat protein
MSKRLIIIMIALFWVSLAGLPAGAQSSASIMVNNPTANQQLDTGSAISIGGTGTALFENSLVVQILNSEGRVLAEQPTTTNAPEVGGTGNWQVTFTIGGVTTPTEARVYAFATSPEDGRIVAEARVNVVLMPPVFVEPRVDILTPANSVVLPVGSAFTVTGSGLSLYQNRVIVQALDLSTRVLTEQTVFLDGSGNWSAQLTVTGVNLGLQGYVYAYSPDASGQIVASDQITVTYGDPNTSPQIIIVNPQPNQVLDTRSPVRVSGSSRNLFQGNVTVAAYDTNGNVLAQQSTTASDISVNGAGGWQVDLRLQNVPRGTAGHISAYSNDANGRVAVTAKVNVIYGQGGPILQINSPPNNSIVYTDRSIRVNGIGINLLENRIFVRALDANGNILAEQMTRASTPSPQGISGWQVDLPALNVTPNTRGTIYAFITRSLDGVLEAETRINVIYGGPCILRIDWPTYMVVRGDTLSGIARRTGSSVAELTAANCLSDANLLFAGQVLRVPRLPGAPPVGSPSIAISTPLSGTVLDLNSPVAVSGSASGLPQGNVTVRALDMNGVVLAQQSAVVNAPNIGGAGEWQASLTVNTTPGTVGSIYVFAASPLDGSVSADAVVDVVYGVSSSNASITIINPAAYTTLPLGSAISISGMGAGLFENTIFIRVLDNNGNVLVEAATTADANGNWLLNLPLAVAPGTRGMIFAYSTSPLEGSILAATGVNVIFGQALPVSFVTISEPLPYTILDIKGDIPVSGRGGGLFEGSLVVRAVDSQGNILDEEPVTIAAVEAGGEGDWDALLQVNVRPGTRGVIYAFAISPADGSIAASASTQVVFGSPADNDRFVNISTPLPDTPVMLENGLVIAGWAAGAFGGEVTIQVRDLQGNVLVSQPATISNASADGIGIWQAALTVPALGAQAEVEIYVYMASPSDGSVLAADRIRIVVSQP